MATTHFLRVAGIGIVKSPDRIRTLLGSCVGVVIYDPQTRIGGVAHIMLPDSKLCAGCPGKFADTGVDTLLSRTLGAGCRRENLRAKIAGGATLFGFAVDGSIGTKNIEAVSERLAQHKIHITASDVGGTTGRSITFDPATGRVGVEFHGGPSRTI